MLDELHKFLDGSKAERPLVSTVKKCTSKVVRERKYYQAVDMELYENRLLSMSSSDIVVRINKLIENHRNLCLMGSLFLGCSFILRSVFSS